MERIVAKIDKGSITKSDRARFDTFDRKLKDDEVMRNANNGETRVMLGNSSTSTDRDAVLNSEHRYSDWLHANHEEIARNAPKDTGSWPTSWDDVAGVSLGFSGDDPTKYVTRRIAEPCIAAGADQEQLERWIAVGQGRAELTKAVPQTYRKRL